jgi:hypothetical protein
VLKTRFSFAIREFEAVNAGIMEYWNDGLWADGKKWKHCFTTEAQGTQRIFFFSPIGGCRWVKNNLFYSLKKLDVCAW